MKLSKKDKLILLEESLIYDIKKYQSYSIDLKTDKEDYSTEYLFNQAVYSFLCYKRATAEIQHEAIQNDFNLIQKQVIELIDSLNDEEIDRIKIFYNDYFSVFRLNKMMVDLEGSTLNNNDDNKIDDYSSDLTLTLCELIDNANLIKNLPVSKKTTVPGTEKINYLQINTLFNDNIFLLSYYSDVIENIKSINLIPIDELNDWWYQIMPLTEERLGNIFERHSIKMKQNLFISDILIESAGTGIEKLKQLQDDFSESISWVRNQIQIPELNVLFSDFMVETRVAPAYKRWSDTDQKEKSDYEVTVEAFKNIASFNKEIIEDLIELVNEKEEQIDQQKRKEILATAYLMLGKSQKAIEILDSE